MKKSVACLLFTFILINHCTAMGLATAVNLAQKNNLQNLIQHHTLQADIAKVNLLQDALYPKIGLVANLSSMSTIPDYIPKGSSKESVIDSHVNQENISIAAQIPILNLSTWHNIMAAKQFEQAAKVNYQFQQRQFTQSMLKLYLGNVLADELYRLAQSHYRLVRMAYHTVEHRKKTSTDKKNNLNFVRSILYSARAKSLQAKGLAYSARQFLEQETQSSIKRIHLFKPYLKIKFAKLNTLQYDLKQTRYHNVNIILAEFNYLAYRQKLASAHSTRLPTIQAVGSYTLENGDTRLSLKPTRSIPLTFDNIIPSHSAYVAVSATLPLYSGNIITNKISLDVANLQKARATLRLAIRSSLTKTRIDYSKTVNMMQQVKANYRALQSHTKALTSIAIPLPLTTGGLMQAFFSEQTLLLSYTSYDTALINYFEYYSALQMDMNRLNQETINFINRNLSARRQYKRYI